MRQDEVPGQSALWIYKLNPHEIYYLKFILESYEGVATLSTLDSHAGVVKLTVPPGCQAAVQDIMEAVGLEIEVRRLGTTEQNTVLACC
jgi:hypothetical protein